MLGKFHFFIGIAIVIIFLLTGQYMHHNYNHLQDMELMNRVLFRAGHIYILLFGLINVALGLNFQSSFNSIGRKIQFLGSCIVFIASFLVIYGFFIDLPSQQIERPITRISLYLILLGVSIHGLLYFIKRKN